MADVVNWMQVAVTSAATLAVPVVAKIVTGFSSKSTRLLGELRDVAVVLENLPDGHPARVRLHDHADTLATQYAESSSKQATIRREPGPVVLGVSIALIGANFTAISWTSGGIFRWFLFLSIPMFVMGLYGAVYEMSGGKSRVKAKNNAVESDIQISEEA